MREPRIHAPRRGREDPRPELALRLENRSGWTSEPVVCQVPKGSTAQVQIGIGDVGALLVKTRGKTELELALESGSGAAFTQYRFSAPPYAFPVLQEDL